MPCHTSQSEIDYWDRKTKEFEEILFEIKESITLDGNTTTVSKRQRTREELGRVIQDSKDEIIRLTNRVNELTRIGCELGRALLKYNNNFSDLSFPTYYFVEEHRIEDAKRGDIW